MLSALLECFGISPKPKILSPLHRASNTFTIAEYRVSDTEEGVLVFKRALDMRYGVLFKRDDSAVTFAIKIVEDQKFEGNLKITKEPFRMNISDFSAIAESQNHLASDYDLKYLQHWEAIAESQLVGEINGG